MWHGHCVVAAVTRGMPPVFGVRANAKGVSYATRAARRCSNSPRLTSFGETEGGRCLAGDPRPRRCNQGCRTAPDGHIPPRSRSATSATNLDLAPLADRVSSPHAAVSPQVDEPKPVLTPAAAGHIIGTKPAAYQHRRRIDARKGDQ